MSRVDCGRRSLELFTTPPENLKSGIASTGRGKHECVLPPQFFITPSAMPNFCGDLPAVAGQTLFEHLDHFFAREVRVGG
jgi:hypothetical protein